MVYNLHYQHPQMQHAVIINIDEFSSFQKVKNYHHYDALNKFSISIKLVKFVALTMYMDIVLVSLLYAMHILVNCSKIHANKDGFRY